MYTKKNSVPGSVRQKGRGDQKIEKGNHSVAQRSIGLFPQASPYKGNGKKEIRKRRSVQKSARMLGFRATLRASLPQQARFIPAGPETEDEFPLATKNELAKCPSESTDSPPAPASIR